MKCEEWIKAGFPGAKCARRSARPPASAPNVAMQAALTIVVDGLTYASWLFIVALGLTLVFGVLKILNIAHGSFYALGAYAAASFVGWGAALKWAPAFSLVAMLLAAVAVAAVVAPLTERGLLRFFYGRDEVLLVLVTYALFLILEDVTKLMWGINPYFVSEPYGLFGSVNLGVADLRRLRLRADRRWRSWSAARSGGASTARASGKIVLAVIHSAEIASSMGVNVSRVYMLAFTIGIFLAGARRRVHRADDLGAARRVGRRDHRVVRGGDHRRPRQHRRRGDRRASSSGWRARWRCTWRRWPSCSRSTS